MKGKEAGFAECPHCGKESEFTRRSSEAYVICSDHNCWGGMDARWGTEDDPEKAIAKMRRNWNKRVLSNNTGLDAAIKSIEELRKRVYEENQRPFSRYDQVCVDLLDEVLFKMRCFVP